MFSSMIIRKNATAASVAKAVRRRINSLEKLLEPMYREQRERGFMGADGTQRRYRMDDLREHKRDLEDLAVHFERLAA